MSNLNPGTTDYVKAYAVNGVGIAFGPTIRFTTAEEPMGAGIRKSDFPPVGGRTNDWTQKASLPNIPGLGVNVAFSIGTKGYVGSGYDDALHLARDFWEWDQATNVDKESRFWRIRQNIVNH